MLSPDQPPATSTFKAQRDEDAATFKLVGHNEQMQFLSRVETDTTTAYGQRLKKGTVVFLRQEFDTVENPYGFWADGRVCAPPRAGVHFLGFGPSAQHNTEAPGDGRSGSEKPDTTSQRRTWDSPRCS